MPVKDNIYDDEYLNHKRMSERRKFAMADVSGRGNEVVFEVNWNSLVKKKGFIKMTINGQEAVVSREHLWAILFMFGSAEEQGRMASPFLKRTQVTKYFKMIGVTASKDIKKGEMLNIPLDFTYNPETHQIILNKGSIDVMRKKLIA